MQIWRWNSGERGIFRTSFKNSCKVTTIITAIVYTWATSCRIMIEDRSLKIARKMGVGTPWVWINIRRRKITITTLITEAFDSMRKRNGFIGALSTIIRTSGRGMGRVIILIMEEILIKWARVIWALRGREQWVGPLCRIINRTKTINNDNHRNSKNQTRLGKYLHRARGGGVGRESMEIELKTKFRITQV